MNAGGLQSMAILNLSGEAKESCNIKTLSIDKVKQ
jgi:hypothetical protein